MKKKIITVALVLSSVCAMAQQKENRDTDGSILRGSYETNSFWSNWYIGVGGGINIYEGEFDNKTSVGEDGEYELWSRCLHRKAVLDEVS